MPGALVALAERLQRACPGRGLTVAVAESCTGGLVAATITEVAGSSGYFLGGVVSYANEAKEALLDVPTRAATHGAVSAEVAAGDGDRRAGEVRFGPRRLGHGGRRARWRHRVEARRASPTSGSPAMGRSRRAGWQFDGDRAANREAAARAALEWLIEPASRRRDDPEALSELGAGSHRPAPSRPIRSGERIHILGIAGAGASAAALHARAAGAIVTGCDPGGPSPYTQALEAVGIPIEWLHDPAHIGAVRPDRLSVTKALTAISPDHPELLPRAAGVALEPWQQLVADAAHGRTLVAVAGTHGKSTTAGWLTWILAEAGVDPSAFVGALLPGLALGRHPRDGRIGAGRRSSSRPTSTPATSTRTSRTSPR